MSTKKKKTEPTKVDLLQLSDSQKINLLKQAKDNLRQKLEEARFWQSLAEIDRVTINGQTIGF
jgi:tRNA A37 threonylcarbamoyladenosine dehydratase